MDFTKLEEFLFETRGRMKHPDTSDHAFDLIVSDFNIVYEMSGMISGAYERTKYETVLSDRRRS